MKHCLPQLLVVLLPAISFSLRVTGSSNGDDFWLNASVQSLNAIWGYSGDDIYAELLKP